MTFTINLLELKGKNFIMGNLNNWSRSDKEQNEYLLI